jgi:hypothetical protein
MFEPEQLAGKKNSVLLWLRLLDFYRGSQVALSGTTLKTMPDYPDASTVRQLAGEVTSARPTRLCNQSWQR